MHTFDEAIRLVPSGDHRWTGATHPAYANMVGPFGGTTCAVLLNAVMGHAGRQGEPVALTVNFAAPVADGAFEVEARPVRTNRSTQHWVLQMLQGDGVVATATAVTALRRETWSAPEAVPPADMPAPGEVPEATHEFRPPWATRYEMRFVSGGLPAAFDGVEQPDSLTRLWLRDRPPRPLDAPALAAISDAFFPRIFIRRGALTPIGTVSVSTYFHADAALLAAQGEAPLLGAVQASNFRNGYFDQSAHLWGVAGDLLATTHQVVYYRG